MLEGGESCGLVGRIVFRMAREWCGTLLTRTTKIRGHWEGLHICMMWIAVVLVDCRTTYDVGEYACMR